MAVIYRPAFDNQIVAGGSTGKYDCLAWAAKFAIDRATLGGLIITGRRIRSMSSEPVPLRKSPGLNMDQIVAVAAKLGVTLTRRSDVRADAWAGVLALLRAGRGVVISVDYDAIGSYSCQRSFLDFHGIYLNNLSGTRVLVYDPLCTAPRYMPISVVKAAALRFASQTTRGIYYAYTRVTPNISPKDQINA